MDLENIIKYLKRGQDIINFEDEILKISDIIPVAQQEIRAYKEYIPGLTDTRTINSLKKAIEFRKLVINETSELIKKLKESEE